MPRSLQSILSQDQSALAAALGLPTSTARIEIQSLLLHAMKVTRAHLLAYPEQILCKDEETHYQTLLQRRLRGEPIAYLLGEREFFGLMFTVTPATLIPRPETELLVELALQRIPVSRPNGPPLPQAGRAKRGGRSRPGEREVFRVLDLGTGSGAIALSIAHARPDIEVVAVDASIDALTVARENVQRLGIGNAVFAQSDWYAALHAQRFDLIVSNPPYVALDDPHLIRGDLRFEPASALASGNDGLKDIRHIAAHAREHLQAGGWLLLEHGYNQASQVRELLRQADFRDVFSERDLAGIERVSGGRL